jgi:putative chitinase
MKIDRKRFFEGYRKEFSSLSQDQVDALNGLLTSLEQDPHITDLRHAAYMLATTMHETAFIYRPIHEYGSRSYFINRYGGQTALGKRLGNDTPEEGALYAGVGFVQLTGEDNFERLEADLRREYSEAIARFEARTGRKFDLTVGDQPNDTSDPNNAMDPEIAYCIMSYGMRHGRFTGRKLFHYFTGKLTDWINARKIINGLDKAQRIATYGQQFYRILYNSIG